MASIEPKSVLPKLHASFASHLPFTLLPPLCMFIHPCSNANIISLILAHIEDVDVGVHVAIVVDDIVE
jgi:hypothetical protein